MKYFTLLMFAYIATYTTAQSNSLSVYTSIVIDTSNQIRNVYPNPNIVHFSKNEMQIFKDYLYRFALDTAKYKPQLITSQTPSLNELYKDSNTIICNETYLRLYQNKFPTTFNNDFVSFSYIMGNTDENGNQIYDEDGNPTYIDVYQPLYFYKVISNLESLENWDLNNSSFIKTSNFNSLSAQIKNLKYSSKTDFYGLRTTHKSQKSNLKLFKPAVIHDFTTSRNRTYLSNEKFNSFIRSLVMNINAEVYNVKLIDSDLELNPKQDSIFMYYNNQKKHIPYYLKDIVGLRFEEDWYLDQSQFNIVKKVKSVTFLVNNYHNFILSGYKPMPFKIEFEY